MQFIAIFKFIKKFWWVLPLIGLIIYISTLKFNIKKLNKTVDEREQQIYVLEGEIQFKNEKLKNQMKQIEVLKNLDAKIKKIEKKYYNEKMKNKKILEKYKKDMDTRPIMKRIENMLLGGDNE